MIRQFLREQINRSCKLFMNRAGMARYGLILSQQVGLVTMFFAYISKNMLFILLNLLSTSILQSIQRRLTQDMFGRACGDGGRLQLVMSTEW